MHSTTLYNILLKCVRPSPSPLLNYWTLPQFQVHYSLSTVHDTHTELLPLKSRSFCLSGLYFTVHWTESRGWATPHRRARAEPLVSLDVTFARIPFREHIQAVGIVSRVQVRMRAHSPHEWLWIWTIYWMARDPSHIFDCAVPILRLRAYPWTFTEWTTTCHTQVT